MPFYKNKPPFVTNLEEPRESFAGRRFYDRKFFPRNLKGELDLRAFPYYGRVNQQGQAIFPRENLLQGLYGADRYAVLSPVAEAYEDMMRFIEDRISSKGIIAEDSFIGDLVPRQGWYNINRQHYGHLRALYSAFSNTFLPGIKTTEVYSFDDFVLEFFGFMLLFKGAFRITRSGFILSKHSDVSMTGLAISHETEGYGDDNKKAGWLEDKNYKYYSQTARAFGFFVDKHAPWRLIADVESDYMKQKVRSAGFDDRDLIGAMHYRAIDTDVDFFKRTLVMFYNSIVNARPDVYEYCIINGDTKVSIKSRLPVEESDLPGLGYPLARIKELYLKARVLERGKELEDDRLESFVRNSLLLGGDQYLDKVARLLR